MVTRAENTNKERLPESESVALAARSGDKAAFTELAERYVDAHERSDVPALAALLHDDLRFSMPPEPGAYVGRDEIVKFWVDGGFGSDRRSFRERTSTSELCSYKVTTPRRRLISRSW